MYSYNNTTEGMNNKIHKAAEGPESKRPQPDRKILDLLIEALTDEQKDFVYYGKLMNMARSQEDKDIIRDIQMDEQKHFMLLSDIYYKLTGRKPKIEAEVKPIGRDLLAEYEKSIFGELGGNEFYRKLYFAFMNVQFRDIIFELMSDEMAHAVKFNYLYSKNK